MKIDTKLKLQLAKFLRDFVEIKTDKGVLYTDVAPAVNSEVYVQDANNGEMNPAPSDTYTTVTQILTVVNGVISNIEDLQVEKPDLKPTLEDPKKDDTTMADNCISTDKGDVYISELKEGAEVLDADGNSVPDGIYTTDTQVITVAGGLIQTIEDKEEEPKDTFSKEELKALLVEFQASILADVDSKLSKFSVAKPVEKEIEEVQVSKDDTKENKPLKYFQK